MFWDMNAQLCVDQLVFFDREIWGFFFGVAYESENIAVIKSCTKIFGNICFHLTRIKKKTNLRMKLLGHRVDVWLTLKGTAKQFSRVIGQISELSTSPLASSSHGSPLALE